MESSAYRVYVVWYHPGVVYWYTLVRWLSNGGSTGVGNVKKLFLLRKKEIGPLDRRGEEIVKNDDLRGIEKKKYEDIKRPRTGDGRKGQSSVPGGGREVSLNYAPTQRTLIRPGFSS